MTTPFSLIEQTGRRLIRQRQINALSCFLPIGAATGIISWVVVTKYSLPALFFIIPVLLISVGLVAALWSARRKDSRGAVASLIDEKVKGQERFLTLATFPPMQPDPPFFVLLQQDAAQKGAAFVPTRDVPFRLDRKVSLAWVASVLSVLLVLLLAPREPVEFRNAAESPSNSLLAEVEEIARTLLAQGMTPQEQAAGAQLLLLAEELKNPALSPEEKQQLIEEAQKRIKLSLPQLLPFDLLKQFASDSKDDKEQGNEGDQPQPNSQPLAKANQNQEQLKKSLSAAAGNEPQVGPQQQGEKKEQQPPRESGGGITFNQPQPQTGEKPEQKNQEPSGQQQQSAQEQIPNSQMPGTDPNRPGGQQDQSKDPDKKGPTPGPQPNLQQEKGQESTIGGSPGERYFQPGEQPGGFLTKDARYVKVRVPAGETTDTGSNKRVESQERSTPKTPYSNAPLKEGPPDQIHSQQPIPLEYRAILQ